MYYLKIMSHFTYSDILASEVGCGYWIDDIKANNTQFQVYDRDQ